jgi:membrane protease subunit HflK
VIAQAQGETNRFSKLLAEYIKAPDVTRKRLYIESMESVLAETNTVMVDVKGGNNLLYLPLDKMMQHQPSPPPPMSSQPSTADQPQSQPVVVQEQAVERTSIRSRDARGR